MGDTRSTRTGSLERTTVMDMRAEAVRRRENYEKQKELNRYVAWSLPNGVLPFGAAVDELVAAAQRKLSPGDVIEVRATEYWNDHRSSKSRGELNGEAVFNYRILGDGNGGLSAELEGEMPPKYPHFIGDLVPGVEKTPEDDGNLVYCKVRLAITRKVGAVERKVDENDGGMEETGPQNKGLSSLGAMLIGGGELPKEFGN